MPSAKKLPDAKDIDVMALAYRRPKGKRPWYFDDPAVEKVLNITMAVAGELAVTRERLDAVERLLDVQGTLKRAAIDGFVPDERAIAERDAWRHAYLTRILRVVTQELEAIEAARAKRARKA
jgi:hypothetical protein